MELPCLPARRAAFAALGLGLCAPLGSCSSRPPAGTAYPAAPVVVHIAALNDFHGALYEQPIPDRPGRARGGLPWVKGALDTLRAEHEDLLLLDGGDLFQGAWPVNASQGLAAVAAYDLLGVDAAAVGNHEFDYGGVEGGHPQRGALEAAARAASFRWLAANVTEVVPTAGGSEGAEVLRPWAPDGISATAIVERGGLLIGLVGLSTMDTPQTTLRRNVADLRFQDPVEALRIHLPELRAQGAQVVIVLGHLTGSCPALSFGTPGPTCDPGGEIGRLLTELPEGSIDVLVVGHAHALIADLHGRTFVLSGRSRGQVLGRLDLVVGPDGVDVEASTLHPPWELVHDAVDPGCSPGTYPLEPRDLGGRTVTPSAEALALVDHWSDAAGDLCLEVGCSGRPLVRSYQQESELGNLVADALLEAFPSAEIAVQNSGGLRADLPAGTVRHEDLLATMPFPNRLLLVEMKGEAVRQMFRLGSSGAHGILQVAGASYAFDPEKKTGSDLDGDGEVAAWERDRLCSVQVGGQALSPDRLYRVVTSDFLLGGGDHLGPAYAGARVLAEGPLLRDALLRYVDRQEGCLATEPPQPPSRIQTGPCPGP